MKSLSLYILLSLISLGTYGEIPQRAEVDKVFAQWDKENSPGASLGIIKDGKLVYSRGYGMANLEYGIPNSSKSVFRIGSTSKQFTAASIILLAQQGKLNLNDTLEKYFPEFPDYAKNITITHLLNHTSGIRDYLTLSYLAGMNDDDFYTDKEVIKWLINQQSTNFKPGEKHLYSNSGYWLLSQIVEKVYGDNMAIFAQKEIFNPLKMNNTHFHNNHNQIVKNRASGYMPNDKNGYEISMTTLDMIGDGGIFTTIEDIKKWDDAFYNSKTLNNDFWKMMTKQGRLNNGEELSYAAGLSIGEHKGLRTISHGGAFVGFRAELIRFPDQKLSIAIFANRGDASPSRMSLEIADILLKDVFPKKSSSETKSKNEISAVKLSDKELQKWAGDYWYTTNDYSRKIYLKDNALYYHRSEQSETKLIPLSKNEFTMFESENVSIKFSEDDNKVKTMSFSFNGAVPNKALSYKKVDYSIDELKAFSGEYLSSELSVTYKLNIKNEQLVLLINDNEASPLASVKENLFLNSNYGAFYFERDNSGKVISFKLSAGRVKNIFFTREH